MGFKEYWGKQFGNPTGFSGRIATFIMNRMNQAMYQIVLQEIQNQARVLDIGFGNGYLLKKLLEKKNSHFYGIDISHDMLAAAFQKNKKAFKNGRLELRCASVDRIPFDTDFHQIYSVNTVYFWSDLTTGLREIFSKLKNGGEFLMVCYTKQWLSKLDYAKSYQKYTEEELQKAMQSVGFQTKLISIEHGKSFYIKAIKK